MDRPSTDSPVEKARLAAGVSMLELERRTGIARTTLRRQIKNPATLSGESLSRIATALNADDVALYAEIMEASR